MVSMLDKQDTEAPERDSNEAFKQGIQASVSKSKVTLGGESNLEQGEIESSNESIESKEEGHLNLEENISLSTVLENGSDDTGEKSAYTSVIDSDSDVDGGSPISCSSPQSTACNESQSHPNHEWLFRSCEDEIGFGVSDWIEYSQASGEDVITFVELLEANENSDDEPLSTSFSGGAIKSSAANSQLEVGDGKNSLERIAQIRGTGRPDLDDGEDECAIEERECVVSSACSLHLGSLAQSRIKKSHLEEGVACSDLDANAVPQLLSSEMQMGKIGGACSEQGIQQEHSPTMHFVVRDTVSVDSGSIEYLTEVQPDADLSDKSMGLSSQEVTAEFVSSQLSLKPKSQGEETASCIPECTVIKEVAFQEEPATENSEGLVRKKGCIMRLGSKEAQQILQMDVTKLGRAVFLPVNGSKESNLEISRRAGVDWAAEDLGPDELSRYVETLEVKETYIDTVLDMEDVLFDLEEGNVGRNIQSGKHLHSGFTGSVHDGGHSASTSSPWTSSSKEILQRSFSSLPSVDWVEVVGAVQRRGGASLGERVIGVKEHTVYRIRVKGSGGEWEVLRRYRDFVSLYSQLQLFFSPLKGVCLPPPWEKVKGESRKFFGNTSPDVVEMRSALLQVCIQSLLQAGPPLSIAKPLLIFLGPSGFESFSRETLREQAFINANQGRHEFALCQDYSLVSDHYNLPEQDQEDGGQSSSFGKTIRLIVQLHKKKSLKQQLQVQHYTCAGCYKHLELALGLVSGIVQNLGWRGPRLCEYSGQLFCTNCHLNETAVIPAWVLQRWDFAPQHVSQLAKAYLDSIYDKPMLCASAVNPYLYARVPILGHLTEMRRKLSKMLACIHCPARSRILVMFGSRRYLLENNDFFALRDLADLSKGAFAVLPGYMQAMLQKLSLHITRECSLCQEVGEGCGAGELCEDPLDILYPFQDDKITRCQACHLPFHKTCFKKCHSCTEGRPVLIDKDSPSHNNDFLVVQDHNVQSNQPRDVSSSSRMVVEPQDHLDGPKWSVSRHRQNILSNLFGSRDNRSSESQKERQSPMVVNMSPLTSSLEL